MARWLIWGIVILLVVGYVALGVPKYWLHQSQQQGAEGQDYIIGEQDTKVYPFLCASGPCQGKEECNAFLKAKQLCQQDCKLVPEDETAQGFNQRILAEARKGKLTSQYLAYKVNFLGIGQEPDALQAFYWLHTATNNGVMDAVLDTASYRMQCKQDPYGKRDALHYLTWAWEAAQNQDVGFSLAIDYKNGSDLVAKDQTKSIQYFTRLSEMGYVKANVHLSNMYRLGQGVAVDYKKAFDYVILGITGGDLDALFVSSIFYAEGLYVERDKEKALEIIEAAAKQGHKDAIELL